jgi:hypothetical protein
VGDLHSSRRIAHRLGEAVYIHIDHPDVSEWRRKLAERISFEDDVPFLARILKGRDLVVEVFHVAAPILAVPCLSEALTHEVR